MTAPAPEVTFATLDGALVALVPLQGDPAGRRAKLNAEDWTRLSRRAASLWVLEPGAPHECVVAARGDEPTKHSEMVARLVAQPLNGWAVRTHNDDATDLRRCNLYLHPVDGGRDRECPSRFIRRRRPRRIALARGDVAAAA